MNSITNNIPNSRLPRKREYNRDVATLVQSEANTKRRGQITQACSSSETTEELLSEYQILKWLNNINNLSSHNEGLHSQRDNMVAEEADPSEDLDYVIGNDLIRVSEGYIEEKSTNPVTSLECQSLREYLPARSRSPTKRPRTSPPSSLYSNRSEPLPNISQRTTRTSSFRRKESSSPGKSDSIRSSSPEKLSSTLERSDFFTFKPQILFSHKHVVHSQEMPLAVQQLRRRLHPDRLMGQSIPVQFKERMFMDYPEEYFSDSIFSHTPTGDGNHIVKHVRKVLSEATQLFIDDADESKWYRLVDRVLNGAADPEDDDDDVQPFLITPADNRALNNTFLPVNAPTLRVDRIIEANPRYPSKLKEAEDMGLRPSLRFNSSLSPLSKNSEMKPIFTIVEVKQSSTQLQTAQHQIAIVGAATLTKCRSLGAGISDLPCIPALTVVGHIWQLHLIYETGAGSVIIGGPWAIGQTTSFVETLKVVLVIRELKAYGKDTWWPNFVENTCLNCLE